MSKRNRPWSRLVEFFPRYTKLDVAWALTNAWNLFKSDGARRGYDPNLSPDGYVAQPWPFELLIRYCNRHPFLGVVYNAKEKALTKEGWDIKPRFIKKCEKCGKEYQTPVAECDAEVNGKPCGGSLIDPDPTQKKRLQALIDEPNRDDEMLDIISSWFFHGFATCNSYLSILPLRMPKDGNPTTLYQIYVEDSENMYIASNGKARKGNGEYFCGPCSEDAGNWGKTYSRKEAEKLDFKCPKCGGPLKETAYVEKTGPGGDILARFSRDEIMHSNFNPRLPSLYGIPYTAMILYELRSSLSMNAFNLDWIGQGKLAQLIILKESTPQEANDLAADIAMQDAMIDKKFREGGIMTGNDRKLRTRVIGSKGGGEVHNLIPDAKSMQSIEWMKYWFINVVGAIHGVQPVFMNTNVSGSGGYHERMQIVVGMDRIRAEQKLFEDDFNESVTLKMGVTDWLFKFNNPEPRDELAEVQILASKVDAGLKAIRAGLDAKLTDEGELVISGDFDPAKTPTQAPGPDGDPPTTPAESGNDPFRTDKTLALIVRKLDEVTGRLDRIEAEA